MPDSSPQPRKTVAGQTAAASSTPSAESPARVAQPAIGDYGLIGDCHSAALVSRDGAIDWCCLPRFDSDSCFARLLDGHEGGHFTIQPVGPYRATREYVGESLVLATTFHAEHGTVRLLDFFAMRSGGRRNPRRELIRIAQCTKGSVHMHIEFCPRFDFGEVRPWLYEVDGPYQIAVGSNTALLMAGSVPMRGGDSDCLVGEVELRAGDRAHDRIHQSIHFLPPELIDALDVSEHPRSNDQIEQRLEETLHWWRQWSERLAVRASGGTCQARSALTLKALTFAPTGAMVAAPTTSLPEVQGGERNWDYRFSWIRDSVLMVHALDRVGCSGEARAFARFIMRSAAGHAGEMQVMYGIDGKRRLTEVTVPGLRGWRDSKPVRIGNDAANQFQADMYGMVVDLAWQWAERGVRPDAAQWRFLRGAVDIAAERWRDPDRGIWELRGQPRHFLHSKVLCWLALERGLQLAQCHGCDAPIDRWRSERAELAAAIEQRGVDPERGAFVAAFDSTDLDAAALLLPSTGFVAWDDPRMVATVDAVADGLVEDGLVLRYRSPDGLRGDEGAFLACTFWLSECLARQGRVDEARVYFDRACGCANDLGLFAEEYDTRTKQMLGNFPQGFSHLAHLSAAAALGLDRCDGR